MQNMRGDRSLRTDKSAKKMTKKSLLTVLVGHSVHRQRMTTSGSLMTSYRVSRALHWKCMEQLDYWRKTCRVWALLTQTQSYWMLKERTSTTPSCSGPILAQKIRGNWVPGSVFFHIIHQPPFIGPIKIDRQFWKITPLEHGGPEMKCTFFHRNYWKK